MALRASGRPASRTLRPGASPPPGTPLLILKTQDREQVLISPKRVAQFQTGALAQFHTGGDTEILADDFSQEEVVVEIQKGGVRQRIIAVVA